MSSRNILKRLLGNVLWSFFKGFPLELHVAPHKVLRAKFGHAPWCYIWDHTISPRMPDKDVPSVTHGTIVESLEDVT